MIGSVGRRLLLRDAMRTLKLSSGGHQIKKMSHAARCIQLLRAFDRNTKANEAKTLAISS